MLKLRHRSKQITIRMRLMLALGLLSVLLVAVGAVGLLGMRESVSVAKTMYNEDLFAIGAVGRIQYLMADSRAQVLLAVQHDPSDPTASLHDHPITQHTDAITANTVEINALWDSYRKRLVSGKERDLAEAWSAARTEFGQEGILVAKGTLRAEMWSDANEILLSVINPAYAKADAAAKALLDHLRNSAEGRFVAAETRFTLIRNGAIASILLGLIVAAGVGYRLVRAIVNPLDRAVGYFDAIARGHYDNDISVDRDDEVGKVLVALRHMQTRLAANVTELAGVAQENLRVKVALDSATARITVSDAENVLSYMNPAAQELLAALAGKDAHELIGRKLSSFFDDPGFNEAGTWKSSTTQTFDTVIGERILKLTASPVYDGEGEYQGNVTQWVDRTQEVAIEKEVAAIIDAAAEGDFDKRISLEGKEGFFKQVSKGVNSLVGTAEEGLSDVGRVLEALSQGDLTKKIDREYRGTWGRLKDDVNATVEKLKEIVGEIKVSTDAINTAAKEIAAGNTDLSSRTESQASSLEETASSMEGLTSTVKQNAENARQANHLARGASDIAQRGGTVVSEAVDTMQAIHESSKKIVDIISVIDGIAFQTNILALNAAVEAARAGEQGRGFAVVASEVRNLAQRSAAAAKEIKGLIQDSVGKVEGGSKQVEAAGRTMSEVVDAVKRVTEIMSEISAASSEQSSGIEQVNRAVTHMDEGTQQNAALVEEAAAAAESLEEQAVSLSRLVGVFRMAEEAGKPPRAASPEWGNIERPAVTRSPGRNPAPVVSTSVAPSQELEEFFDKAVGAHTKWRSRLRMFVDGTSAEKLDPAQVARDDCCDLGRWIYGEGKKYQADPEYTVLRGHHARFHRCAANVVHKVLAGDRSGAQALLRREFEDLSNATVGQIGKMKRKHTTASGATPSPAVVRRALPLASGDDDWKEF